MQQQQTNDSKSPPISERSSVKAKLIVDAKKKKRKEEMKNKVEKKEDEDDQDQDDKGNGNGKGGGNGRSTQQNPTTAQIQQSADQKLQ